MQGNVIHSIPNCSFLLCWDIPTIPPHKNIAPRFWNRYRRSYHRWRRTGCIKFNSLAFLATLFTGSFQTKWLCSPDWILTVTRPAANCIKDNPVITDIALFASAEIKPTDKINLRPGLRFIKTPFIMRRLWYPPFNAKFNLNKQLDHRLAYAYGFRSPALRELYLPLLTSTIYCGQPDLKAEYSNIFPGCPLDRSAKKMACITTLLTTYYNVFKTWSILHSQLPIQPIHLL